MRRVALVTGKLAEPALREVAERLRREGGLEPRVVVLNIQVAALLTADWVSRKLELPAGEAPELVLLPGDCGGDPQAVAQAIGVPVELGPRDLRDLPAHFGLEPEAREAPSEHRIEILAEINNAAYRSLDEIHALAADYAASGADVIDLGCEPQVERAAWSGAGPVTASLVEAGYRVSIDSFHPEEVAAAAAAGAELVLSVNGENVERAAEWGIEVVAIPDEPKGLAGLDATVGRLERDGVPFRIDPIVEPIGFGFAESLGRCLEARRRYPDARLMLGIGNLSEMTAADSAGVNALLIGFCEELGIGSVLTTEVVNWARSSVREIDIARRLMHAAVARREAPKHIDQRLVSLRDPKLRPHDESALAELAASLTDANVRIFADHATGKIHAMNRDAHAADRDPAYVFDALNIAEPSHAFYLGWEMAKASTALQLGKNYAQDEALSWGFLTEAETSHYERRKRWRKRPPQPGRKE